MHIAIANYGNDSIALIQWAYEQQLSDLTVVSVDTGFAAPSWPARVQKAEHWVRSLGFTVVRLKSQVSFAEVVKTRGSFPSRKFQWCAGFLKGLAILEWLDSPAIDPEYRATILLAYRRSQSRKRAQLPELLESSEHYNDRHVWHPLFQHSLAERDALVQRAGFPLLGHRSLECDPCIQSTQNDWMRMEPTTIDRLTKLETELGQTMFTYADARNFQEAVTRAQQAGIRFQGSVDEAGLFDQGCESPFGCGL